MFRTFKIQKSTIAAACPNGSLPLDYSVKVEERRIQYNQALSRMIIGDDNGIIDGTRLANMFFPTISEQHYDVFISHSHNDELYAKQLAYFLEKRCGLSCFIDEYVWGSADNDILKPIDDEYCRQVDGYYNYEKRNLSTSHVHAMLSMALMDIIDHCECCIFLKSDRSISLSNIGDNTLSPWLYEEISMMNKIRCNIPSRFRKIVERRYFSQGGVVGMAVEDNQQLQVSYKVDLNNMHEMSQMDLYMLKLEGGYRGLNGLYFRTTDVQQIFE